MGYAVHPWSLMIFFMLTSVVAIVRSTDELYRDASCDRQTGGVGQYLCNNADHPCRCETFRVCVIMSERHIANGTQCRVLARATFQWGRNWEYDHRIGNNWNVGRKCYDIKEYYCDAPLTKLRVFNSSPDGTWFPAKVIVRILGVSDACYVCDWGQQCSNYGGGAGTGYYPPYCRIGIGPPTEITCARPSYGDPYCS